MSQPSYKNLKSYQQAVVIYDLTVEFCKRYLDSGSRTVDQMEQAARSGKQNIVEGNAVSKDDPKNELFLLGVARASLEELLEDYKDFLRQQVLEMWDKDDPKAKKVRQIVYRTDRSDRTDKYDKTDRTDTASGEDGASRAGGGSDSDERIDKLYRAYKTYMDNPGEMANAMVTLISQTNYLLDKQISGIKKQLDEEGIVWESKNKRSKRILEEKQNKKKEEEDLIKKELKRMMREGKDLPDHLVKLVENDKPNRIDKSNKTDKADKAGP